MMVEREIQNGSDSYQRSSEKEPSFSSSFDLLSNESLGHVVSYCDFHSALRFARATSRSIRQDLYRGDHFLWKDIFHRHHFSLPMIQQQQQQVEEASSTAAADYLRETQQRRQLARNILAPTRVRRNGKAPAARSCCFNLPNRCFYFVPVTPDDGLYDAQWDDPPPVDFGCDSFILTSTACGGEMVSLDPFHGTLAVYESCLDNSVASDEGMMEQAMLEAANLIDGNRDKLCLPEEEDWPEEDIAGAVFDQSVYRNHNISQYKKPPFQMLFRLEEDIDLEACFPPHPNENNLLRQPPPEIEVGYHGIDTKCILDDKQNVVGSMIAVGRMFTKETRSSHINGQRHEQVCTELICWTRRNPHPEIMIGNPRNQQYEGRKLCRFPWSFRSIDLCSAHNRVYVSFDPTDGPMSTMPDSSASLSASTVVVYQMLPHPQSKRKQRVRRRSTAFQAPEFLIRCKGEVSAIAVDPAGDTLVVGTAKGTCEVWSILSDANGAAHGKRTAIINITASIVQAFRGTCGDDDDKTAEDMVGSDSAEESTRRQSTLPTILNQPKTIASFHHPSHCPLSICGFVTLQHSSSDGSSLLLWRKSEDTESAADIYKIESMISLPLSGTTRAPRVFFDGRRILVFGQDHIGLIILVYHVLASYEEDIHLFQETTKEETSGGVYNLTTPSKARFANRIRHAALGGLQYYESIHMTCNDRFIVVNTKTGNLLSASASPYAEGLLVIDLQD